jgi:hypothetical protein
MHRDYADAPFAAISVSLDELTEPGVQEKVVKYLQSQKATFTNFILDEKPEFWQAKLKINGPPSVFVFNQEGGIARQFKDEVSYDDVKKVVKELLGR